MINDVGGFVLLYTGRRGYSHSEQMKQHLSEMAKKRPVSSARMLKMQSMAAESNRGRKRTVESRKRMSEAQRIRFQSDAERERLGLALRGKTWEDIYGPERAAEKRIAASKRMQHNSFSKRNVCLETSAVVADAPKSAVTTF